MSSLGKLQRSGNLVDRGPQRADRALVGVRRSRFCKGRYLRVADVYTDRSIAWINGTDLKVRFRETFRARSGACAVPT